MSVRKGYSLDKVMYLRRRHAQSTQRALLFSSRTFTTLPNCEKHTIPELKNMFFEFKDLYWPSSNRVGFCTIEIRYKGTVKNLPVVVVPRNRTNLLGRGGIKELGMEWEVLHMMQGVKNVTLPEVLSQHEELF